jgi:hypothetical protein
VRNIYLKLSNNPKETNFDPHFNFIEFKVSFKPRLLFDEAVLLFALVFFSALFNVVIVGIFTSQKKERKRKGCK